MPDQRKHRGPHPRDAELFAPAVRGALREAAAHLAWLLSRGYAGKSALKLVGDRFQLTERQRVAVMRSTCSDEARRDRAARQLAAPRLAGRDLHLDGFNVLTTIEAALAGGVILCGRDGCYRDMASMHGSYRKVDETQPALILIGEVLDELAVGSCHWYLDRPVSNSGRLAAIIRELAARQDWPWQVDLVDDVDRQIIASQAVVASADCGVLDHCGPWFNLAREVVQRRLPEADVVDCS